jgi:hypothetical protein
MQAICVATVFFQIFNFARLHARVSYLTPMTARGKNQHDHANARESMA